MPPEAVGEAVLEAIRENRAEVLVTKGPTRPLIGLYALAPQDGVSALSPPPAIFEFARDFTEARKLEELSASKAAPRVRRTGVIQSEATRERRWS